MTTPKSNNPAKLGFTLVEVMIAAAIMAVAAAMATGGFIYVLRAQEHSLIQTELDSDAQIAMERLKYQLRLSDRNEMLYYPPGTGITHTAVSFPVPTVNPQTGLIVLDTNGQIAAGNTVIYHAWTAPFSNQLRVTTFSPRNNARSLTELQTQLAQVVLYGNGNDSRVLDRANGSTEVVFENLFSWNIGEIGGEYDAYAATTQRETNVKLGTVILGPGDHTFKFTVVTNNASCTGGGCKIGIDSMSVSRSGSRREGEAQRVSLASVAPKTNYMANGSWDGNYQLYFPATNIGQSFTLTMANDVWEDTNFRGLGEDCDKTDVYWDTTLNPSNYIVSLKKGGTNWQAAMQTSDSVGTLISAMSGYGVRVVLRGKDSPSGGWILQDGPRCRLNFRSCAHPGRISSASIALADMSLTSSNSVAIVPGTSVPLTFGGATGSVVPGGVGGLWSDYVAVPQEMASTNSYVVSFIWENVGDGRVWVWRDAAFPAVAGSYLIPAATAADMALDVWTSNSVPYQYLVGVQAAAVSFPSNGTYTSEIFDTTIADAPVSYSTMSWIATLHNGTLQMKVRTGNNDDLSDATTWQTGAVWSAGAATPLDMSSQSGRYVQWGAAFTANSNCLESPKLKSNAVGWTGSSNAVDISGSFTKGPNYGVFQVTVDGQLLRKAVGIDLSLYESAPTTGSGTQTLTSALNVECEPRNTGKWKKR